MNSQKLQMKIEIWSDVMCPFCYIGKRKFEAAFAQFKDSDCVTIEWKSFQLSPSMVTNPNKNIHQFLAEHKGISLQEAIKMNDYVSSMAAQVGLEYNFDKAIVANSFNAHMFSHFAKNYNKQDAAEEKLFHAYFTEGKNTDDINTLLEIAKEIGLDDTLLKVSLQSNEFANEVKADIEEAQQIGIRGVPFFVFDRKYAVSGAQDVSVFVQTLQKSYDEWQLTHHLPEMELIEGQMCIPGEECK